SPAVRHSADRSGERHARPPDRSRATTPPVPDPPSSCQAPRIARPERIDHPNASGIAGRLSTAQSALNMVLPAAMAGGRHLSPYGSNLPVGHAEQDGAPEL